MLNYNYKFNPKYNFPFQQGIEVYKGKFILYGCGEFINDYDLYEELLQTANVRFFYKNYPNETKETKLRKLSIKT